MNVERRVLITGGAGFVGFHLATALAAEPGTEVTLVDNLVRGRRDPDLEALLAKPNVKLVVGDITEKATFDALGGGYQEVYHLAAIIGVENVLKRPHDVVRVNAISTILLMEWLAKGGGDKVLFSSTSEAYAWTQGFHALPIPTPEDVPLALTDMKNPRSSYAGSKIFGELVVSQYGAMFDKAYTIVRFHNVYGPRMGHEHVIPQLTKRALAATGPLTVYSADHMRAFCYVSDAVDLVIAAMRSKAGDGETFNVGNSAAEVTMGDLAKKILARVGKPDAIEPAPAANDPIKRRCPDVSRAARLLGYAPKVDLDRGLALTMDWYVPVYEAAAKAGA